MQCTITFERTWHPLQYWSMLHLFSAGHWCSLHICTMHGVDPLCCKKTNIVKSGGLLVLSMSLQLAQACMQGLREMGGSCLSAMWPGAFARCRTGLTNPAAIACACTRSMGRSQAQVAQATIRHAALTVPGHRALPSPRTAQELLGTPSGGANQLGEGGRCCCQPAV